MLAQSAESLCIIMRTPKPGGSMSQDRNTVFSFSCGGFFAGSHYVKIEKVAQRYEGTGLVKVSWTEK